MFINNRGTEVEKRFDLSPHINMDSYYLAKLFQYDVFECIIQYYLIGDNNLIFFDN